MKTLSVYVLRATGVAALLVLAVAFVLTVLTFTLPSCASEDDTFCYWNAVEQGNGKGHSFLSLWDGFILTK